MAKSPRRKSSPKGRSRRSRRKLSPRNSPPRKVSVRKSRRRAKGKSPRRVSPVGKLRIAARSPVRSRRASPISIKRSVYDRMDPHVLNKIREFAYGHEYAYPDVPSRYAKVVQEIKMSKMPTCGPGCTHRHQIHNRKYLKEHGWQFPARTPGQPRCEDCGEAVYKSPSGSYGSDYDSDYDTKSTYCPKCDDRSIHEGCLVTQFKNKKREEEAEREHEVYLKHIEERDRRLQNKEY